VVLGVLPVETGIQQSDMSGTNSLLRARSAERESACRISIHTSPPIRAVIDDRPRRLLLDQWSEMAISVWPVENASIAQFGLQGE
jgi:hypothetical protein